MDRESGIAVVGFDGVARTMQLIDPRIFIREHLVISQGKTLLRNICCIFNRLIKLDNLANGR
jgi:hypothetical protein